MTSQHMKQSGPPESADVAGKQLVELKNDARELWKQSRAAEKGSAERTMKEVLAARAREDYNTAVDVFGKIYGYWFETGVGKDGWSYVRRLKDRD